MRILTATLLVVAAVAMATPQTRTSSIQGVVVKSESTDVLAETSVELTPASGGTARYTTITDATGQFRFTDIPPGDFRLAAMRTGYLRSEYGQRGPSGRGLVLTITAGQLLQNIRVELTETGAISGRIFNVNGLPFANVQVQAMKYGSENGRRVLRTVRAMLTDDLGQYRIFWLPPGEYVVMARPLRVPSTYSYFDASPTGGINTRLLAEPTGEPIVAAGDNSVPLFFPGTTMVQSATIVEVRSGGNARGIDLTFTPLPTHRVRGTVTGIPAVATTNGLPRPTFTVSIEPRGETVLEDASAPRLTANINPATGAFELDGVFPGSYYLSALANVASFNANRSLSFTRVRAEIPLDVVGADIDNVSLQMAPLWAVSGRVSIEDAPGGAPNPDLRTMPVRVNPGGLYADVQTSGVFTLRIPRSGDYQLWVDDLPENSYLKSILQGGRNVLDTGLRVESASEAPVDVVISLKAATASGRVIDSRGNPAANVLVTLIPDNPRRKRIDLYQSVTTDAAGRFRLTGIAPGSYKVFAWEGIEEGAWRNAEFITRYEDRGKPLTLAESANATIEVALP